LLHGTENIHRLIQELAITIYSTQERNSPINDEFDRIEYKVHGSIGLRWKNEEREQYQPTKVETERRCVSDAHGD